MTTLQLGHSNARWQSLWPQTMSHLPGLESSVNLHLMGKIRRNLLWATIEFGGHSDSIEMNGKFHAFRRLVEVQIVR